MAKLRGALAGWAIFALCGTLPGQLPRRNKTAPATSSGPFDFYMLSLSWAPEFCTQPGAAAAYPEICARGEDIGFVVRGFWPVSNDGKIQGPCGRARPVPKAVVDYILPYMLSPRLIQEEWAAHGTCTGLTPSDYFGSVLQARAAVQTPVEITAIEATAVESPSQIEGQFASLNSAFPAGAFRTACRNGALTEERVCFNKNLSPRSCGAEAEECVAPSVTILAPR